MLNLPRLETSPPFGIARPKEVRAWTVPVGATAPQAARVIHTDFERGFIRAEVIAYADYVSFNREQGAKEVAPRFSVRIPFFLKSSRNR